MSDVAEQSLTQFPSSAMPELVLQLKLKSKKLFHLPSAQSKFGLI